MNEPSKALGAPVLFYGGGMPAGAWGRINPFCKQPLQQKCQRKEASEQLIRGMPVPKEEADQKRRQQRPMPCCCSPPSPLQKGPCSSAVRRRSPTPLLASAELTIKSPAKRQPPSSSKSHWTADCTKSRSDSSQRGSLLADCLFASFVAALFASFVCCSL